MKRVDTLNWETMRVDWPHREHSKLVCAQDQYWHVQTLGQGETVLLVHGTGASSHSWAEFATLLSKSYTVVMVDLPGHGFSPSVAPQRSSLPGMAEGLDALLDELNVKPQIVVGHSAGAAILAQMCLQGFINPAVLISLNGAFLPFNGVTGQIYSRMARILSGSQIVPWMFSLQARNHRAVQRLIDQTGSKIPKQSAICYQELMRSRSHVSAALQMMANWNLSPLYEQLPKIRAPIHLVACQQDKTVPVEQAHQLHKILKNATLHMLDGLGHLGHEENPGLHADLLYDVHQNLNHAAHRRPS